MKKKYFSPYINNDTENGKATIKYIPSKFKKENKKDINIVPHKKIYLTNLSPITTPQENYTL